LYLNFFEIEKKKKKKKIKHCNSVVVPSLTPSVLLCENNEICCLNKIKNEYRSNFILLEKK